MMVHEILANFVKVFKIIKAGKMENNYIYRKNVFKNTAYYIHFGLVLTK